MATGTSGVDTVNPYKIVEQYTDKGETLLSLCAGIGLELNNIDQKSITAVDLSPQYTDILKEKFPEIDVICSDALDFVKQADDNSYDVISFLDGLEHLDKEIGRQVLEECKRVAKKRVILFFPSGDTEDGYLAQHPHNAWNVEGADEYQTHKSGWLKQEVIDLGYKLEAEVGSISQHGDNYKALLFYYIKE